MLHYEYRWSVAGGQFGAWQAHRAGSPRIVVGGLANGREHVFALRAVNPAGPGLEARAAATPGAAPGAPAQLTATRGDGAVTLRWGAPSGDGGVAVSDYQYRYQRCRRGRLRRLAVRWRRCRGHGRGARERRRVRVRGARRLNAVFVGASASAAATPGGAPAAPAGLVASPADGRVTLTWSAPETDGGLDIVPLRGAPERRGADSRRLGGCRPRARPHRGRIDQRRSLRVRGARRERGGRWRRRLGAGVAVGGVGARRACARGASGTVAAWRCPGTSRTTAAKT